MVDQLDVGKMDRVGGEARGADDVLQHVVKERVLEVVAVEDDPSAYDEVAEIAVLVVVAVRAELDEQVVDADVFRLEECSELGRAVCGKVVECVGAAPKQAVELGDPDAHGSFDSSQNADALVCVH